MRFVFGVPAHDLPGEYNLEVLYDEDKKVFCLNIETIFQFQSIDDELAYYIYLLNEFGSFMKQSGFDTDKFITLNELCSIENKQFKQIETAYAWFKWIVESHMRMYW